MNYKIRLIKEIDNIDDILAVLSENARTNLVISYKKLKELHPNFSWNGFSNAILELLNTSMVISAGSGNRYFAEDLDDIFSEESNIDYIVDAINNPKYKMEYGLYNVRASIKNNRFSKGIKASDLKYSIEKINGDNWRPGMPKSGYLVRYNLSDRFGWMGMKTFATREEAEEFANTL